MKPCDSFWLHCAISFAEFTKYTKLSKECPHRIGWDSETSHPVAGLQIHMATSGASNSHQTPKSVKLRILNISLINLLNTRISFPNFYELDLESIEHTFDQVGQTAQNPVRYLTQIFAPDSSAELPNFSNIFKIVQKFGNSVSTIVCNLRTQIFVLDCRHRIAKLSK